MRFIDLCSGIGSAHLAFKNLELDCAGYSEIDSKAEETYKLLHGSKYKNYGDLMRINCKDIPDIDILLAGFPCQTFSIAGKRKGFADERGQIIFGIENILKEKQPKGFILENVKGLVNIENGNVANSILEGLREVGYNVCYKVLDSINYGTPQMRERVYFVGIRSDLKNTFIFPEKNKDCISIQNFLTNDDEKYVLQGNTCNTFIDKYLNNKYNKGRFVLKELLQEDYLVIDTRQSDLRLYRDRVPTIRKGRQGILYVRNGQLRKLSGMEALLLQGFTTEMAMKAENYIPQSALLSQAGNAMTVNVMQKIGTNLLHTLQLN